MTIKHNLFISNILMLVIPVLLSILVVGVTLLIATGVSGVQGNRSFSDEEFFNQAVDQASTMAGEWPQNSDLVQMKADVKNFNEQYGGSVSLSLYQGSKLLYPVLPLMDSPILDAALSQEGTHLLIMDNIAVYRENAGAYSIVLTDANFVRFSRESLGNYRNYLFNFGLLMLILIIGIILLTNRFLTQRVFRSIITPLDTLVYGVHQIRDGQLDYRIDYAGKDEFSSVCSDFNEMAQRLLEFVNARQKDEANRRELIVGISHDLRTPLTSIKAYLEGIEKGVASTPIAQKRYLDTIKDKTDDLEHIVNQLFLFSKLDIGEFPFFLEKVDIDSELTKIIADVSDEYEKKGLIVTLTQRVQKTYVEVDIVQLRNAVINILENSVKYKDKKQCEMKITCSADDSTVTVTLMDNGPGVPHEAVEKLFDVFYRGDPSRSNPSKGSGLGLAITAKILERLGGAIRAENVPEGGLAVVITLPKKTGGDCI